MEAVKGIVLDGKYRVGKFVGIVTERKPIRGQWVRQIRLQKRDGSLTDWLPADKAQRA
jgi:hypothetical protein